MLISSLSMFQHLFECTSVPRLGAPFVLKKMVFSPLAIRLGAVYIGLRAPGGPGGPPGGLPTSLGVRSCSAFGRSFEVFDRPAEPESAAQPLRQQCCCESR